MDNCEHLLDPSAGLAIAWFGGAAGLTVPATSREAIGVAGELTCSAFPPATFRHSASVYGLAEAAVKATRPSRCRR